MNITGSSFFTSRRNLLAFVAALALLISLFTELSQGIEQIIIGRVEDVVLLPWEIKLPARIDTGATISCLDARDLSIKDNFAEFRLPSQYSDVQFRLPIVGWRTIRSAESREKRPIVELEFCIGPKRIKALVNLNDRSRVKYPVILGRNILKKNFIVDSKKTHHLKALCPKTTPE